MRIGRQVRLGGLLVAAVVLGVVVTFALGHSQARTSQATSHGAMAVDCDASQDGIQAACTYAPGSSFNIQIHITQAPAGGYNSSQAKVEWTEGVVNYLPTASTADEALGPNCAIPARDNNAEDPVNPDPSVLFACTPFPPALFTDTGAFLTFEFACKGTPENLSPPAGLESNQSLLRLVPRLDPPDPQQGSHFTDLTNAALEPGPALTNATVTCGEVTAPPPPPPPPPPEIGVSLTGGETVIAAGDSTVLTFTVVDADGPVEGADCTFSIVGPDGTDATLSSTTGTTDANGDVSVTLTAGTTPETVQVEADCGALGSFVQDVTVSPTLPSTGAALDAEGGISVGLWAMIGAMLVAAAAGLTVYGWRSTRAR